MELKVETLKMKMKMSDNIPLDIQEEIIKRVLPVKSLIRFRSLSKQCKSLIDSSEFIADHSVNPARPHHLLVRYKVGSENKFVSILDDDSFPRHNFCPTVSSTVARVMVDSSHGLVCLYGAPPQHLMNTKKLLVLWNPSIKKSIEIVLPYRLNIKIVGFGVCLKTCDPKIVIVKFMTSPSQIDLKAEVFTLSSGAWRGISMSKLVLKASTGYTCRHVVIDGIIYWAAYSLLEDLDMIISFDLTSEEFGEIEIPDSLAHPRGLSVSKLKESLAVLSYNKSSQVCDVWTLTKNADPKSSLTKLFTVSLKISDDSMLYRMIGFRKNGQPITEHLHKRDGLQVTTLEVYEPRTEHSNDIGTDSHFIMNAYNSSFMTTSYAESLLLLNHRIFFHA